MIREEKQLLLDFKTLLRDAKHPTTQAQCIKIISQINGGIATNPSIFFSHPSGELKSLPELSTLSRRHLGYIFKDNTMNSENSKMLTDNVRQFNHDQTKWKTLDQQIVSAREDQGDQEASWRIPMLKTQRMNVFFTAGFKPRTEAEANQAAMILA